MSGKATGAIWATDYPRPTKYVLLALAEHANPEGEDIFPGVDLLAHMTGYSERQIQRTIADLVDSGALVAVEHLTGGRGKRTVYRLNFDAMPKLPDRHKRVTSRAVKGDISAQERVTFPTIKGDILNPKGCHLEPKNEGTPLREPIEPINPSVVNRINPAHEKPATPAAENWRARTDLFDAYCGAVGIAKQSGAYVRALNLASVDLPDAVLPTLTPDKVAKVARYVLANWAKAGITKTPRLSAVLEHEPEYDRWAMSGEPDPGDKIRTDRMGRALLTSEQILQKGSLYAIANANHAATGSDASGGVRALSASRGISK